MQTTGDFVAAAEQYVIFFFFGSVRIVQAIFVSTDNRFLDSYWLDQTVRAHRAVNRAIHDRDRVAATRRMGQHVHAYAEVVLETPEATEFDLG